MIIEKIWTNKSKGMAYRGLFLLGIIPLYIKIQKFY